MFQNEVKAKANAILINNVKYNTFVLAKGAKHIPSRGPHQSHVALSYVNAMQTKAKSSARVRTPSRVPT